MSNNLQFVPPPAYLVQDYYNRKQPAEIMNEGVNNALQTYVALKKQQQDRVLAQQSLDLKANEDRRQQGEYARNYAPAELPGAGGAYNQYSPQDMGQATAPTLTADAQMRSMLTEGQGAGPATLGPSAGVPAPDQGIGPRSPIIDHWNATAGQGIGMGQNTALAPAPRNPQEQANLEFAKTYPMGIKGQATTNDVLAMQDADGNIKGYTSINRPVKGKTILTKPTANSAGNKTYIGNDAEGNPLFADKGGSITPGTVPNGGSVLPKSSTMPTSSTRASAEFANTIIPHIQDMRDLVKQADAKGFIGPMAGRVYGDFMAGKVGTTGNAEADQLLGRLRATDSLLKTGAMRVHFGARGGGQMYDHFSDLLNSGKQSAAMLNGSLDTLESFMQGYSNAGKVGGTGGGTDSQPVKEGGYSYTPGPGGRANKANWKKQ